MLRPRRVRHVTRHHPRRGPAVPPSASFRVSASRRTLVVQSDDVGARLLRPGLLSLSEALALDHRLDDLIGGRGPTQLTQNAQRRYKKPVVRRQVLRSRY